MVSLIRGICRHTLQSWNLHRKGRLGRVLQRPQPPHVLDMSSTAKTDPGGQTIRVTYPTRSPESFFNLDRTKASMFMELLDTLENQLNFTVEFVRPKTGSYGIPTSNGSFDGMIGELGSSRADFGTFHVLYSLYIPTQEILIQHTVFIAIGDFTLSSNRAMVATTSVELWKEVLLIYYSKRAARRDIYWQAFLEVFNQALWITLGIFIIFFIVAFLVLFLCFEAGGLETNNQ